MESGPERVEILPVLEGSVRLAEREIVEEGLMLAGIEWLEWLVERSEWAEFRSCIYLSVLQ